MTTERFDKAAAQWDAKPRRVELATIITDAIGSALPLNTTMTGLEYGCGTGLVTFGLAGQLRSMVGLDNSTGMITVLNEKIADLNVTNVSPLLGGLADLDVGVDLLVISMTLHHIDHYKQLLADCLIHLNPGGFLVIVDIETEDGSFHKDNTGICHFGFDPDVLCQDVQAIGFVQPQVKIIHRLARHGQEYPIFLLTAHKV